MAIWKITAKGPSKVIETKFKKENLFEHNLEDWIESNPSILGESLLIIGRQVLIPDTRDKLDLLAVDPLGNSVIIELKRGKLKDPVDMQALRYASYISKWKYEDFENLARAYLGKAGDAEFNFNAHYESFCEEAGVDDTPDLNEEQRIIIVGNAVREKLGSVALWLYEHAIDIKVIEVHSYKDGNDIFIEPTTVVPMQVSKFIETGRIKKEGSPWLIDGRNWHLEKRCSSKTREMLFIIDNIIKDNFNVDGPRWNQKHYIAYKIGIYNWLAVITTPNILRLQFLVKANSFTSDKIAKRLNIVKFEAEESFSEKINLPSSVFIKNRNDISDRMNIRVKDDFNLKSEEFINFLKDVYKAFPK